MNQLLHWAFLNMFVSVWQKLEPVVITEGKNIKRIEWVVKPFEGFNEFPDALLLKVAFITARFLSSPHEPH